MLFKKEKSKKKILLSGASDIPVLHFLWRWKVSTTLVLCTRFYSMRSLRQGYERLLKLEHGRFIRSVVLGNGEGFVWELTKSGFDTIVRDLPELRADGFLSENRRHDLLVSAIQLGPWLSCLPKSCEIFTEQELRCLEPSTYSWWVPQTQLRRPDGYWFIPTPQGHKVISLEVELTQKAKSEYEKIRIFYEHQNTISNVIWVVETPSLLKNIHHQMSDGTEDVKHNFLSLVDLVKNGWQARVLLGKDSGLTLSELLSYSPRTSIGQVRDFAFLDLRKSPHKSNGCGVFDFSKNPDCGQISPNNSKLHLSSPSLPTRKESRRA